MPRRRPEALRISIQCSTGPGPGRARQIDASSIAGWALWKPENDRSGPAVLGPFLEDPLGPHFAPVEPDPVDQRHASAWREPVLPIPDGRQAENDGETAQEPFSGEPSGWPGS